MDDKIYKVVFLISYPDSYLDINNKPAGFLIDIWNYIENILKKKYKFQHIILDINTGDQNLEKSLNSIHKGDYDILVGPCWKTSDRAKLVDFSHPILLTSPLILYDVTVSRDIDFKKYITALIKIWILPIIFAISLSFIVAYFYNHINIFNFQRNFFNITIAFFGNKNMFGDIEHGGNTLIIVRTFILFFIFFFQLLFLAWSVSKTYNYFKKFNILNSSIKGSTFYVMESSYSNHILKKYGAQSIDVRKPYVKYKKNKYKKKVDGFVFDGVNINPILHENTNLVISDAVRQFHKICIILNKSNKTILKEINKLIREMHYNGKIYYSYKKMINNSNILC